MKTMICAEGLRQEKSPSVRALRHDEHGAVMVMGLFFALLLIAGMWSMKGLGDAVVYRQRMQEAADHEVYAAAVVHARGMNLVAAINVLMRVLALLWIVMSVLRDLLVIAMGILGACAAFFVTTLVCTPLFAVACNAYTSLVNARNAYERFVITPVLPVLSGIETAASLGYPWIGSAMAANVGSGYDASAMALGPSHVPGLAFDVPLDSMFDGTGDSTGGSACEAQSAGRGTDRQAGASDAEKDDETKLGLPLVNVENAKLCELAADSVANYFPGFLGDVLSWVAGAFTEAGSYCSGFPWETKMLGWKRMYKPAKNGSAYMQVWDLSFPGDYDDGQSSAKVALGEGTKRGLPKADALEKTGDKPKFFPFFAQAEFFYACGGKWAGDSCNGDVEEDSHATFNMKWRARLRPVALPKLGPFSLRDALGLAEKNHTRFASSGGHPPSRDAVREGGAELIEGISGQGANHILH